jgi:hypothetical protein
MQEDLTKEMALAQRSYVGYIGPLSASCLMAGKKPVFDGVAAAKTAAEKSAVSDLLRRCMASRAA